MKSIAWIHRLALFCFWTGLAPALGASSLLAHILWVQNPEAWIEQWPKLLCFHLFYQMMYMLDRLMDTENSTEGLAATELLQPNQFSTRYRSAFLVALACLVAGQVCCIWLRPQLLWAVLGCFFLSSSYFAVIPIVKWRIKDLPFVKNFYGSALSLFNVLLFFSFWPKGESLWFFGFVSILLFLNTNIYDLKDLESDRVNGIRTFANSLSLFAFLTIQVFMIIGLAILAWFALPHSFWLAWASLLAALGGIVLLYRRPFDLVIATWLDIATLGPFFFHELYYLLS